MSIYLDTRDIEIMARQKEFVYIYVNTREFNVSIVDCWYFETTEAISFSRGNVVNTKKIGQSGISGS